MPAIVQGIPGEKAADALDRGQKGLMRLRALRLLMSPGKTGDVRCFLVGNRTEKRYTIHAALERLVP